MSNHPPLIVQASQELAADIIRLVRLHPTEALRSDTRRAVWGLAVLPPDPDGRTRGWVALSLVGCAQLAPRLRSYLYTPSVVPSLEVVGEILASSFKCARKQVDQKVISLFALGPEYGSCGEGVLLLQASPENLPWMAGSKLSPEPELDYPVLQPGVWSDALHAQRSPADPMLGQLRPPPDKAVPWLRRQADQLLSCQPLAEPQVTPILTSFLTALVADEMARLRILHRCYPTAGFEPPSWMSDPDPLITEAVIAAVTTMRQQRAAEAGLMQPPPAPTRPSRPRRPSGAEATQLVIGAARYPAASASTPSAQDPSGHDPYRTPDHGGTEF